MQDTEGFLPMQYAGFAHSASGLLALFPFSTNTMELAPRGRRRVVVGILERRNTLNKRMFDLAMQCNDVYLDSLLLQFRIGADSWVKRYLERPWRALHHAAEGGRIEMVSLLLSHHASVEAKDRSGWRALHIACYRGHTEVVKMLIQAGANTHITTQRWNAEQSRPSMLHRWDRWKGQPLHLAAMGGHAEAFKLLLEHGANIHAKTGKSVSSPGHGPTALHLALDTGMFYGIQGDQLSAERLEIAQILVDRGAMVKGVIRDYSLEEILRFKNFPRLWDALVAGDS
ncbi:ankyrin repeat-containing protein, putative [Paecilomyces variotii No. 5]|uniref:Ankyrin repeat-containing protein, putative n=1 Tax=Byssochlamys spectabilis (strain No. 5 / NBRC 109023) TaxID=1356009 RepID=V5G542_BYSSN|nr:ankyrin repeat-containing protein, putative [Paecilomyces variotii No. 5]